MAYYELMKQYFDRLALEYEKSISGLGDKAGHSEASRIFLVFYTRSLYYRRRWCSLSRAGLAF
jgi:hypothetical protein